MQDIRLLDFVAFLIIFFQWFFIYSLAAANNKIAKEIENTIRLLEIYKKYINKKDNEDLQNFNEFILKMKESHA